MSIPRTSRCTVSGNRISFPQYRNASNGSHAGTYSIGAFSPPSRMQMAPHTSRAADVATYSAVLLPTHRYSICNRVAASQQRRTKHIMGVVSQLFARREAKTLCLLHSIQNPILTGFGTH